MGRTRPVADATIARRFRPYGDHAGLAFWLFLTRDWVELTPQGPSTGDDTYLGFPFGHAGDTARARAAGPGCSRHPTNRPRIEGSARWRAVMRLLAAPRCWSRDALGASIARCEQSSAPCARALAALALSTAAGFVAGLILGSITGTLGATSRAPRPDPGLGRHARHDLRSPWARAWAPSIAAGMFDAHPRAGRPACARTSRSPSSRRSCPPSTWLPWPSSWLPRPSGTDTVSLWDLVTISVVGGVISLGGDPGRHDRARR